MPLKLTPKEDRPGLKIERCERSPLTPGLLERLQIGRSFWGAELEDLVDPEASPHGPRIHRYCDRIHTFSRRGVGLFLWGVNSVGKTHSASIVLKEAARVGYTGLLITPSLYGDAKLDKMPFDAEQSLVQRIETVDFLFLDDIGKEYTKGERGSGWFELNLERLWRERAKHGRVTGVTTNFTDKEFGARYGKSVRALVVETLVSLNVQGKNFRAAKHKTNRMLLED